MNGGQNRSLTAAACVEKMIASAVMRSRALGNEVHERLPSGTWFRDFLNANPELKKLVVRRVDENQRPEGAESSTSPTKFHLADVTVQAHFRTSGSKALYISCSISLDADNHGVRSSG
jgi:hypothetical protein